MIPFAIQVNRSKIMLISPHLIQCLTQERFFSHCGQNCPENTWERTNQSSGGWCKTTSMMSRRSYWREVAIDSGVMTLCFEQTKTTLKSTYLLNIKAWEKNNQSLHCGRDKGNPSSCPWFARSTTRQAWLWIANHGHSDGIPLSLPECSDRFY